MKYSGVYFLLLFLLGLSVAASFLSIGVWGSLLSLVIAAVKAGLILYYFMKLKESSLSLRILALASLFWIFILLGLTASDYLTRFG